MKDDPMCGRPSIKTTVNTKRVKQWRSSVGGSNYRKYVGHEKDSVWKIITEHAEILRKNSVRLSE